jgi:hypothetical protein
MQWVPGVLTHDDYRDGVNDQIYMMKKEDWEGLFSMLKEQGAPKRNLRNSENILLRIL